MAKFRVATCQLGDAYVRRPSESPRATQRQDLERIMKTRTNSTTAAEDSAPRWSAFGRREIQDVRRQSDFPLGCQLPPARRGRKGFPGAAVPEPQWRESLGWSEEGMFPDDHPLTRAHSLPRNGIL